VTSVRKAVFPAAGLGTRFLPATKAQPKEMLVLVDKPVIQYGVEESIASGVEQIILVTGRGKNAIEDHFDVSAELESFLESRGKLDLLAEVRKVSNLANFAYVRQREPLGLGHAVLVTRELIGNEPFAVILGDDVIDADPPALRQMIDLFDRVRAPVVAVERVPAAAVSSYGIVDIAESAGDGVHRIGDLVEKPSADQAPSNLAIIGRYILTPDIFEALAATGADGSGEIQLTNGLRRLLRDRPIYGCEIRGVRHDTGNKLGFLNAVVYFALRRPDLAGPFRQYLRSQVGGACRAGSGRPTPWAPAARTPPPPQACRRRPGRPASRRPTRRACRCPGRSSPSGHSR
jgi:UTP--glucose-1-phosphate uridylyltransferase